MSRPIPLLLAALTLGLTAAQHQDEARCKTVDEEASCRGLGLLEVPSALPLDVGSLDLSGNQLRSVAAFPLGRYALLRRLDLSANAISSVQPGALGALPRLEHLSLARNRLALGPQGALGLPPALRSLDLSGNGLYSGLAERLLGEAPGLRALSLAENSLTRLTPRTFRGLPALERLDLHGNVLLDIEEGAFEALPRLAHLNLSRNSLTCISRFGLPQLRVLDLSRNSIEAFQTAPAPPAPLQLAWLDLRENRLLRFPDLAALPRLAYLNASGNLLRLPGGGALLAPLPRPGRNASARPPAPLLHLDLSSNEIELVPDGFLEPLTSLRFLNLSGNCLRAFAAPRAGTLPGLLLLDLSHNALAALEPGAGALGALRTLLLRDNALRDLGPRTFSGLAGLRSLDLQGNRLTPCAGPPEEAGPPRGCVSLSGLPALRALNLAGNAMETLPPGAFLRTPLAELDLSRNPGLRVSAGALAGLEASLEALALQGLGLTDLPVDLPRFPRLARLNLAENRLSRLPAWTRAVALEELDLRNNSFRLLPGSAMGGLEPSLRRLYLRGNPLSCCGNAWLAAQLHGGRVRVDATRDLPCRFGARAQLALSRVRPEDCGQQDPQPRGLALLLTLALAAAALLATLATCCCLRRQRFRRRYKA